MRIGASSTSQTLVDARAAGVGVATDPMRSVRNPAVFFVLSASVTRPRRCAGARASRTIAESVPFEERSYKMSRNDDLVSDVTDELYWDPKVDNSSIAASADDGKITLRGTVGSLREKREAKTAAERVFGVIAVDNQLQVRLLNGQRREDAELRGDVLQALMLDSLVPKTVDAQVDDGFVTLTGSADWQYQRDEAEFVAANIVGTLDVFDEIDLMYPTPDPDVIQDGIKHAFKRNAKIDADDLSVSTSAGTVTIEGPVSSLAERDEALAAAWAAPGVIAVDDRMTVEY